VDGTIAGAKTDAAAALRNLRRVMILFFFSRDMTPPINLNNNFDSLPYCAGKTQLR
jgi:hypothetical protein